MATTNSTRKNRTRGRGEAWAAPHDPRTNARPPGNGDLDRRAADKGRERLMSVLGR